MWLKNFCCMHLIFPGTCKPHFLVVSQMLGLEALLYIYIDLAAATQFRWLSGTTPFAIGVGKKGNPQRSTNFLMLFSAWE